MRIAVTGSTGLVGTALVAELRAAGHTVSRVVRHNQENHGERLIRWNPERGTIDVVALEGHDAMVHLAGEPIFGAWTHARKLAIRESRVRGTTLIARTIAGLQHPPRVLVSASAMGYYGNRPLGEALDEGAAKGMGFLAGVTVEWEQAAQAARAAGTRVANTRFGMILSSKGGALATMLPVFRAGLGGKLGSGQQIWSWITLRDTVAGLLHVIQQDQLSGPINFGSPMPVSNEQFTRTLGRVLKRPTFLTVPAFALHFLMQDMAEELLLSSVRMVPRKLLDSGHVFIHPELGPALRAIIPPR